MIIIIMIVIIMMSIVVVVVVVVIIIIIIIIIIIGAPSQGDRVLRSGNRARQRRLMIRVHFLVPFVYVSCVFCIFHMYCLFNYLCVLSYCVVSFQPN